MPTSADSLVQLHPDDFDAASARAWVVARRALLAGRCGDADVRLSVSSGCAATGATRHARELADAAAHALQRWDDGVGPTCEVCRGPIPLERLDGAPAAVCCSACAPVRAVDTRWCR